MVHAEERLCTREYTRRMRGGMAPQRPGPASIRPLPSPGAIQGCVQRSDLPGGAAHASIFLQPATRQPQADTIGNSRPSLPKMRPGHVSGRRKACHVAKKRETQVFLRFVVTSLGRTLYGLNV